MSNLYCVCCGRPFQRTSLRGPVPLYCSQDCRRQIAVRRRVWSVEDPEAWTPVATNHNQPPRRRSSGTAA